MVLDIEFSFKPIEGLSGNNTVRYKLKVDPFFYSLILSTSIYFNNKKSFSSL